MTTTDTNCYGIAGETIATSRRRARQLRSRVMFHLLRRAVRRFSAARPQSAPVLARAAAQPA